ncbi:hypothetical protein GDO86_019105 [Hymenochirus boettgeri]|uniref:Ig-like domain-containing protein n=1 Tax=Hymenochirus boettgeri TaxID=247094 RepID=A0A8T2I9M3_9PIPI|nr:hypothetical protein GDO86_019105 [Hymenochirus boettgeri]
MTSLLLFLVLTVLTLPFVCAQLQITTHPSHIDAQLGSTAILNCSFTLEVTPVDPAQVHVIWKKEGTKVLSYMGNMEVQRPGAQLSEQVLTQGDASLTLPNLTRSDSGKYSCSIRLASEQDTQTITLAVNDYRQIG